MKSQPALIGIILVGSVFMLGACSSEDIIFFGATGAGGATTSSGGDGGSGGHGLAGGVGGANVGVGGAIASVGVGGSGNAGGSAGVGGSGGGSPVDCNNLPVGPVPFTIKYGQKATEDMAFDDAGNLIGADNGNLFKSTFAGQSQIWVPGAGGFITGIRASSKGMIVYGDRDSDSLFKIVPPNVKTFLLGGLSYPNGMEADNDGHVVITEQDSGWVRRVDPDTGQFDVLAMNLQNPNGLSYSPDYKTLYVGSFGYGIIYKITLDDQGNPLSQGVFIQGFTSTGDLDGMGVDACGNVYVCEFKAAKVWRIPPDGKNPTVIADLGVWWIPNMQWGSGYGGWDPMVLYVRDISSGTMYEVPVGVPSKPRKYP